MSKLAHSNQETMDEIERNSQVGTHEQQGYWCVVCNKFIPLQHGGVIVHDAIPHPSLMTFNEQENPQ